MTHTHHPGLVTTWKLRINRRHYIEVFVWADLESMYAADDFNFSKWRHPDGVIPEKINDFYGQAHSCIQAINIKTNRPRAPRKFGEIFVTSGGDSSTGKYGTRIVSHEIAHIAVFWAIYKGWDICDFGQDNERFCLITGELNKRFWDQHYRTFRG